MALSATYGGYQRHMIHQGHSHLPLIHASLVLMSGRTPATSAANVPFCLRIDRGAPQARVTQSGTTVTLSSVSQTPLLHGYRGIIEAAPR